MKTRITEKIFDYNVTLTDGDNAFNFTLKDGVDHEATASVTIPFVDISRVNGTDRYETATKVSKEQYETATKVSKEQYETATDVVLASGLNYPDALAGAVLAKSVNGPLLLTKPDTVNAFTLSELERLGAETVHVLGGTTALTANIDTQLESLGYEVIRYDGLDRYATAVMIGEVVLKNTPGNTVVLTNGDDYGELLAANSYAAKYDYPAIFTKSQKLTEYTKQALIEWDIKTVQVVGDETAVSATVVAEIEALGLSIERTQGDNRELTSLEIAKKFFPDTKKVVIAQGYDYPDALVGGSFASSLDAPILLVKLDSIEDSILTYLNENIDEVVILGGPNAINDDVLKKIHQALK